MTVVIAWLAGPAAVLAAVAAYLMFSTRFRSRYRQGRWPLRAIWTRNSPLIQVSCEHCNGYGRVQRQSGGPPGGTRPELFGSRSYRRVIRRSGPPGTIVCPWCKGLGFRLEAGEDRE